MMTKYGWYINWLLYEPVQTVWFPAGKIKYCPTVKYVKNIMSKE